MRFPLLVPSPEPICRLFRESDERGGTLDVRATSPQTTDTLISTPRVFCPC